jgi:Uma2 family endonuclease
MSAAVITISRPRPKYTVEQYLVIERAATERHQYIDGIIIPMTGETVAMAGETLPHGIISANVVIALGVQLKGTPCFVVTKDTKVRSGLGLASARSTRGMFSYPDILVVCGKAEFFDDHQDVIMNPRAIFEVLSPSTELFDRGEKFQRYRAWNATLQEYVLISQTQALVEHFHRQPDGEWSMREAAGLDATIVLASISCTLRLADLYDRIEFAEPKTGESGEPGE